MKAQNWPEQLKPGDLAVSNDESQVIVLSARKQLSKAAVHVICVLASMKLQPA